jgi:hypothetical protein
MCRCLRSPISAPKFWAANSGRRSRYFDHFRDVVVSGEERLLKPDRGHLPARAPDRFGLAEGEGLFIDDSLPNVEAARAKTDSMAIIFKRCTGNVAGRAWWSLGLLY